MASIKRHWTIEDEVYSSFVDLLSNANKKDSDEYRSALAKTTPQQRQKLDGLTIEMVHGECVLRKLKKATEKEPVPQPGRIIIKRGTLVSLISRIHRPDACLSVTATREAMERSYFGAPDIVVEEFAKNCPLCAKSRPLKPINVPKPRVIKSSTYLERFQVDLVDMHSVHPEGPYRYILNVKDHFSTRIFCEPLFTKTMSEVSWMLLKILCREGFPSTLQSDNGSEFKNSVLKKLFSATGMTEAHSRPYSPWVQIISYQIVPFTVIS
jgi:hypothetical protein